jgi:hypothetical protein
LSFVTEQGIASLVVRSKDSLWLHFKGLKGIKQEAARSPSTSSHVKTMRGDLINNSNSSEQQQRLDFFAKVAKLNADHVHCELSANGFYLFKTVRKYKWKIVWRRYLGTRIGANVPDTLPY